mmetsp:Transcript_8856/g.14355  ORF Transcript_8856/g.14355 Transcript_8856/m.14355 type:complete len:581 (-) Transcript_8856:721-2463(-)
MGTHLHYDDEALCFKIYESHMLGDKVLGRSRLSIPLLLTLLCRPPSRTPVKAFEANSYGQEIGYLPENQIISGSYEGLRTWFSLRRENGNGCGGEVLLHIRFKPLHNAKVIRNTLKSNSKPDTPLASLTFQSSNSLGSPIRTDYTSTSRFSTLRLSEKSSRFSTLRLAEEKGMEAARPKSYIFGAELKESNLQSDTKYPIPVLQCIRYIRQHGLKEEGIFRISGNKKLVELAIRQYDQGIPVEIVQTSQATEILKRYFRELPSPLIHSELYPRFLRLAKAVKQFENSAIENGINIKKGTMNKAMITYGKTSHNEKEHAFKSRVEVAVAYASEIWQMSEPNRGILLELLALMHQIVQNSDENKMNSSNLAIVWAPNILREKLPSSASTLRDMDAQIKCIAQMINYFEEIRSHVKVHEAENSLKVLNVRLANGAILRKEASQSHHRSHAKINSKSFERKKKTFDKHGDKKRTCHRVLFKSLGEGFLEKTGERNSNFKHRYFRLLSRSQSLYPPLLIYLDKHGGNILGAIELEPDTVKVNTLKKPGNTFTIFRPSRTFTFRAANTLTRDGWVQTLKKYKVPSI